MTTLQMIAKAIEEKAEVLARNEVEQNNYEKVRLVQNFCRANNISQTELKNIVDEIVNPTPANSPSKELVEEKKQEIINEILTQNGAK